MHLAFRASCPSAVAQAGVIDVFVNFLCITRESNTILRRRKHHHSESIREIKASRVPAHIFFSSKKKKNQDQVVKLDDPLGVRTSSNSVTFKGFSLPGVFVTYGIRLMTLDIHRWPRPQADRWSGCPGDIMILEWITSPNSFSSVSISIAGISKRGAISFSAWLLEATLWFPSVRGARDLPASFFLFAKTLVAEQKKRFEKSSEC